ncbi:flagellar biosynthesis protein FlhG [Salirhabdus euzebyi]|uniref:Flagellar biosynthesis protein FlhG n=1 Tax=Salirhabdus euzebyi TaxID=394506 RepID=A0A841Q3E6_9BACI|nr:MinD/ParA family protein [Salirhabdus euzebyi]MBB6452905.1 flagellar biosynthesis protein FlhG [Salirhabdus euzebyi]
MTDQAQRLREIINAKKNIKEAKTIAVLSGKGGVGKSNFALNFALGLSKKGKRVLLFDLDFGMGNIDVLMGLAPKKTIVHMFKESLFIEDVIEKGPYSLSYIAAGSGLSEIFEMESGHLEYFLKQLRYISMQYDFIIFDMGAGFNSQHIHFALAAHECFIVTTTEPTSVTDAYAVLKHIYYQQSKIPLFLLVNRAMNSKEGKDIVNRLQTVVQKFLHQELKPLGILPDDREVIHAVKEQTPFLLNNEKSNASKSLVQIIDSYLDDKDKNHEVPNHSFVTKLKMIFTRER